MLARGIFYSFKHHYKHGCLPAFLKRRKRRVYSRKSESDDPIVTKPRCVNHYVKAAIDSNS